MKIALWGTMIFTALGFLLFFLTPTGGFAIVTVIGKPIWYISESLTKPFYGLLALIDSKSSLIERVDKLERENSSLQAEVRDKTLLETENSKLLDLFSRKPEKKEFVFASIITRPGFMAYDSLIVDVGVTHGVAVGDVVYADDYTSIGTIEEATAGTARVSLFSNPGRETPVLIGLATTTPAVALGLGNGNFEVKLPRNVSISEGDPVRLASEADGNRTTIGNVSAIITNPADSFEKILFTLPVNIQLKSNVLILKHATTTR